MIILVGHGVEGIGMNCGVGGVMFPSDDLTTAVIAVIKKKMNHNGVIRIYSCNKKSEKVIQGLADDLATLLGVTIEVAAGDCWASAPDRQPEKGWIIGTPRPRK